MRDELLTAEKLREKFNNAPNYLVIASLLLVSMVIGLVIWWRGHANSDNYHLGGRSMTALPVTLSLVVSFTSGITLLGIPNWVYTGGTHYALVVVSYMLHMAFAVNFTLPMLASLKLTTSYSYLELRFSSKLLRTLCSVNFTLIQLMYMAIAIVAPSIALEQVAGMNKELWCFILFAVSGIYTCLGGIKAVMWTDAIQFVVMLGSYVALAIVGTSIVGTAGEVFKRNYKTGRIQLFNFDPDPRADFTWWTLLIGNTIFGAEMFGTCQTSVQRYLSCKNEATARRVIWWTVIGMSALMMICIYMGMLLFAFYHDCDPLRMGQVTLPDQLVPLLVLQIMGDYPGLPGLLVAGLLSGTLSTVSSGLNSIATVVLEDGFLCYGYLAQWTPRRKLILSRCTAIVFCLVSFGFSFIFFNVKSLFSAAQYVLELTGPVFGVFILGMFFPSANKAGALAGFALATVLQFWLFVAHVYYEGMGCSRSHQPTPLKRETAQCPASWGTEVTPASTPTLCASISPYYLGLYDLSYFWHAAVGLLSVLLVGVPVGLIWGQKPEDLPPGVIAPNAAVLFCWLPGFMRRPVENYYARAPSLVKAEDSAKSADTSSAQLMSGSDQHTAQLLKNSNSECSET